MCKMFFWFIIPLGLFTRGVYGGTCTEAFSCSQTCYRSAKYYVRCRWWGLGRCPRYRQNAYTCTETCYRTKCCTGFVGRRCDTPICFGSTSCPNGGTCQSPNSCRCQIGFAPPICNEINECTTTTHGCQHNCVNTHGSYQCTCRQGFTLNSDLKSCLDVNECNADNGGCWHICNDEIGSYTCDCRSGYKLYTDGKSCYDINECTLGTSGCAHVCTNTDGSYTCSCQTGYALALDRKDCEDIDECGDGSHKCKDMCHNTPGSYTCNCGTGFYISPDRVTCQDFDECLVNNGNCDQICINQPGSYNCECRSGYKMTWDGLAGNECQDIDECTEQTSRCSQICQNTDGSYTCSCRTGFFLSNDNRTCLDVDDCEDVSCQNGGSCVDGVDSFTCTCRNGFNGMFCQTDINECQLFNGGCQDICINTVGSFACSCFEGRELKSDGFSCYSEKEVTVFERLKIPRQLLPDACFIVRLAQCTNGNNKDIFLTSTSEWYTLNTDPNITYTLGIVFVKVNNFSVPVSLRGIEFTVRDKHFALSYGVLYNSTQGVVIKNELTSQDCHSIELVESDFFDIIGADSFFKTFLISLFPVLPDWLQFEKSSSQVLSVKDVKTDLVYGRNIHDIPWCDGAPVLLDHLYTVLRFDTGFSLRVLENEVHFQPLQSRKFCLIVDLCQSNGGTVFLMLPEESRNIMAELEVFRALKEDQNFHILPRGIGISLVNGLNYERYSFSNNLWNGDSLFLPLLPPLNLWMGGKLLKYDKLFTIEGNADIYMGIPRIQSMFTSMFREEWSSVVDIPMPASLILRFKLFKKDFSVTFQLDAVNAYLSFGGHPRVLCGALSNPEGIFLSVMIDINPFKGVPILEDFVISFTNRLYAFVTADTTAVSAEGIHVSLRKDILDLDILMNKTTTILDSALNNVTDTLSVSLTKILIEMRQTIITIRNIIDENLAEALSENFEGILTYLEDIRQHFYHLRSTVDKLSDRTEFLINKTIQNLAETLQNHIAVIEKNINSIFNETISNTISSAGNYRGFGFKYSGDLKIFGLKIIGFDLEIVYSEGDLFSCSRFDEVRKLLDGESALRILGRVSRERSTKLGPFLKYEKGYGLGGALAVNSGKLIIQLQAFISMLGIKATGDLFISRNGIYFYLEGNVWNIFLAQIEVTAEVGKEWHHLIFNLRGRFVAKSRNKRYTEVSSPFKDGNLDLLYNFRKKRQIQTVSSSFQDSYFDALKTAINMISDEVQKRLSQVQSGLSAAQRGLTKAQKWLNEKQEAVREANDAFDNAVKGLDTAKQKLEEAKGPLKEALRKLEDAQKDVDNLCRIQTCSRICIPGIKCRICHKRIWGVKIPYPCCKFTSCMISFPDPLCVLRNIACRIIRAAAYLLLEIAKVFVRGAMLAFDVAKAAVTVAQFVVDKSRVVLSIAEGILELAEFGLEVAKGILEAAKIALEVVKQIIGATVKVLEFVIEYGLKNIIDVRNCGFDVQLSTKDLPVFEVFCEVNAFRLGWTDIRLKINFKNILQSVWQASKATIKAIINTFGPIFSGRKRRDIEFDASSRIHILLRKIRESKGMNFTDNSLNETIDISKDTPGFRNSSDSDSENRIQLFHEKCINITVIQDFMQYAFESLQEIVNESTPYIKEIKYVKKQLQTYRNFGASKNITAESVGISKEYAVKDYNMTDEDLDNAINETKSAAVDDPLLVEIRSAVNLSEKSVDAEAESVESVDYLNAWFTAMKNMTSDYFNKTECEDFKDCVFYSITRLYDLYEYEDLPNITIIKESILDLESRLIETFQNESYTILDTSSTMEYVLTHINRIVEMNAFCIKPPEFVEPLQNQTVSFGTNAELICQVKREAEITFSWLLNDTVIDGESLISLVITNVTDQDAFDKYNCIAGNRVANITSSDAYLIVVHSVLPTDSSNPCEIREHVVGKCEKGGTCDVKSDRPYCRKASDDTQNGLTVDTAVAVGCAVVALAVLILCTIYLRYSRKKDRHRRLTRIRQTDENTIPTFMNRKDHLWLFKKNKSTASSAIYSVDAPQVLAMHDVGNDLVQGTLTELTANDPPRL